MKNVNVPAQITTVEDKVIGSLTLTQVELLAAPVFINFAIVAVLPHSLHLNTYKTILVLLITLVCWTAAIRIKGRIVLEWTMTLSRYMSRPSYYVYNKNINHLRSSPEKVVLASLSSPKPLVKSVDRKEQLASDMDYIKFHGILNNPRLYLSFKTNKRGTLHVYVNQAK